MSSSHQLGFGVCTCFWVADQYAQSRTTAYPKPGTPNLDLATATFLCLKVLMKPICKKAAVGTPARHPIAVAVDQPPETSDDPVDEEAWVSMLGSVSCKPVCLTITQPRYTCAAKWQWCLQPLGERLLKAEIASQNDARVDGRCILAALVHGDALYCL